MFENCAPRELAPKAVQSGRSGVQKGARNLSTGIRPRRTGRQAGRQACGGDVLQHPGRCVEEKARQNPPLSRLPSLAALPAKASTIHTRSRPMWHRQNSFPQKQRHRMTRALKRFSRRHSTKQSPVLSNFAIWRGVFSWGRGEWPRSPVGRPYPECVSRPPLSHRALGSVPLGQGSSTGTMTMSFDIGHAY